MINAEKIESYNIAISTIKKMIEIKILEPGDYQKYEKKIAKKYGLKDNSIFRSYELDI